MEILKSEVKGSHMGVGRISENGDLLLIISLLITRRLVS
jgi:hypothetical protein